MVLYYVKDKKLLEISSVDIDISLRLFSGVGLFETMKIINGVPIFVEEHVDRMVKSSLKVWGVAPEASSLIRYSFEASSGSGKKLGMMRIFLVEKDLNFSLFFYVDDYPYSNRSRDNLSIKVLPYERNPKGFSAGLKPISYFENVVLRERAEREGFDEVIFLYNGFVAEGSRSNFFWVKDGTVFSPPSTFPILEGITRKKVIHLCSEHRIDFRESAATPYEICLADELFITGSVLGIGIVEKFAFDSEVKNFRYNKDSISYFLKMELQKLEQMYSTKMSSQ